MTRPRVFGSHCGVKLVGIQARSAAIGLLLTVSAACGGDLPPPTGPSVPFLLQGEARVARVEVVADRESLSASARALLRDRGAIEIVRQSALDWFDHRDRFDRDGELELRVRIRELRLRSQATALLFSGISGADRLEASVVASRQGTVLKTYAVGAASALGGRVWSDPTERLRRLARLLGQQIALGL